MHGETIKVKGIWVVWRSAHWQLFIT